MTPPAENRQHYRKSTLIIVDYVTPEGQSKGVIKDISAGGMYLRAKTPPSVGQSIRLEFPLFNFEQPILVSGSVTRAEPDGFGVKFHEPIDALALHKEGFPTIVNEGDR